MMARCSKCARAYQFGERGEDCPHPLTDFGDEMARHRRRCELMRMSGDIERRAAFWQITLLVSIGVIIIALLLP